jgi:hypothetical protein
MCPGKGSDLDGFHFFSKFFVLFERIYGLLSSNFLMSFLLWLIVFIVMM